MFLTFAKRTLSKNRKALSSRKASSQPFRKPGCAASQPLWLPVKHTHLKPFTSNTFTMAGMPVIATFFSANPLIQKLRIGPVTFIQTRCWRADLSKPYWMCSKMIGKRTLRKTPCYASMKFSTGFAYLASRQTLPTRSVLHSTMHPSGYACRMLRRKPKKL